MHNARPRFVADEIHRRIDVTKGSQSEALPKLLSLFGAPADQHCNFVRLDHGGQHRRRQIAAWTYAMASPLEETDHMRQKMAVQKHISSLRV